MEGSDRSRILVVANQTPAMPRLLQEVRRRARAGPCVFSVLVPPLPGRAAVDWTPETAVRLLEREARSHVEALAGGADPFVSVQHAVEGGDFDEIIVSTMPQRSRFRRHDLLRRIESLGLPVTAVMPRQIGIVEAIDHSEEVWRSL